MSRLHSGHRRAAALAGAALALATTFALGPVSAHAETIGGELMAGTTRTVQLEPGATPLPTVKAATWILADADTGAVLAQKGSHVRRAPASTLKMLTALTVLPRTRPDTAYVATPKAAYTYGARVGLKPGKTYTMDELWYAVFLPSANDAAIAVAEANGGVRRTVRQMNEVAYELRALDTVAKNTNGLDAPGQLSSAYDLALIARAGLARPDFANYASTTKAVFPNVKGKGSHPIYTTNRLLLHGWKGVIGVKTGFTTQAGRTYVGAAQRGGRTLIVALMGIRESSESAAKKLLSWGFANADMVQPIGTLIEPGAPVPDSQGTGTGDVTSGTTDAGSTGSGAAQGTADSVGTSTTASAAADSPSTLPVGLVLTVTLLVGAAGAAVTLLVRRPGRGRHSASTR